jgi:hypothetical protein
VSFSYTGDPSNSSKDAVRFLLGDTTENTAVFQDEEIEWLLSINSNVWLAAAMGADNAASYYVNSAGGGSGVKTKTVGALSISYEGAKERAEGYRSLAKSLRMNAALNMNMVGLYSGGISVSDKKQNEQDSDWDRPAFTRGMHDWSGADLPPKEFRSTST